MLILLTIRDFVIVDLAELMFKPGFTVLTGETGAGKSILIDALMLALGGRGEVSQIRHGCERAEIIAEFDIDNHLSLQAWLGENDLQGDAGICILRRIIDTHGRSRGYINGNAVTLQQLRTVGDQLVDIHGQHAHQSLLRSDTQRDLLDGYAANSELVKAVAAAFQHWQQLHQQHLKWEQNAALFLQEREQLEWQLQELSALNFSIEEWQALQTDHNRLSHTANLLEAVESSLEILCESESAALEQLHTVLTRLRHSLDYDNDLKSPYNLLETAQVQLQEAVYELKHYQQRLNLDPQSLRIIEDRISAIHALARKYRLSPEEIPDLLHRTMQRLQELGHNADGDSLGEVVSLAKKAYEELAQTLSTKRRKAAETLAHQVTEVMQTLAMAGGSFDIILIPCNQANAHGYEQIEFQVSTHRGLPLRPLAKVASGGELSRISLAIQVITSQISTAPTLIFDEVDVGIGGRVAEIVGTLLKKLGKTRQVLCITHLAQVASMGDQHWQVVKVPGLLADNPVSSAIRSLDEQERVEEIARMLGGMNITATTRQHATEMLQQNKKLS
ncbi:DNA repair protein RecN [Nitrosomonas communis]|uniref:DNA repair protein RecN n=1 Tax=Nitrosomonas communis TaxID=44574 RepID=A0A1I4TQD3_9PROT|nr:DNA repair protein RecN [Nitrosomonas communis]SFM78747.1 DNA repair protein RecN (Recombination protein N) [Nitrosomonas communis]